jgi:primosomal replication protein N
MNRLVLSAQVLERKATRYTPAGLPAVDLTLTHESEITENGQPRQVRLELRAIGIGSIAKQLSAMAVGEQAGFAGFMSAQRNGKGVLFHITELDQSATDCPPQQPTTL